MRTYKEAQDQLDNVYKQLRDVAKDVVRKYTKTLDGYVKKVNEIETLTDGEIRVIMAKISYEAYSLAETREYSALKSEIATTLQKESFATEYMRADGTISDKSNIALLNTTKETAVDILYKNISKLMLVKLDEAHRVVNTLNSILISRSAEAKLHREIFERGEN